MLEMSKESFLNYHKALKRAMYSYVQGKDIKRNGQMILFILKEFDIDIELDKLISVNASITYQDVSSYVDNLFFGEGDLFRKVAFYD